MKSLHLKRAFMSSVFVYIMGVSAFIGSYFVPILEDLDQQANLILLIAMIPAACLGAHYYYKNETDTSGLILGGAMFLGAIFLDALITVPIFMMPLGIDHITFFSDAWFWVIGIVYVVTVYLFSLFKRLKTREQNTNRD